MTREVLILQHVRWEHAALISDVLDEHRVPWRLDTIVDAHEEDALPALDSLGGVVILGGPMGALDVDRHPGLALEAHLVRAAVDAAVPLVGVCLGHQIIATALGAPLHSGAAAEFGILDVETERTDHVFGPAGTAHPAMHWHRDVVEAPAGAVVLASTAQTPNQSFRYGTSVFTTQFHLEMHGRMLDEWLAVPGMAADLPADVRPRIRDDFAAAEEHMRRLGRAAFEEFAVAVLDRG